MYGNYGGKWKPESPISFSKVTKQLLISFRIFTMGVFQVMELFDFKHNIVSKCSDVSEERTVPIFRVTKLVLSIRLNQFCNPEDRGSMILRNVGIFNHYTVQKFQRQSSSENSCYNIEVLYSYITT